MNCHTFASVSINEVFFCITERIEANIVIDQTKEYKVKLNFCPKCKSRLKIGEEECPSCGINIEKYLSNN